MAQELVDLEENKIDRQIGDPVPDLQNALDQTIERYRSKIRFSMFKSKYKEIYTGNKNVLKEIFSELLVQLITTIKTDVHQVCETENLTQLIKSLNEVIEKKSSTQQQVSWRPTGDPSDDLRDHIYPIKLRHKAALEKLLEKFKASNERLTADVNANDAKILSIKRENEEEKHNFDNDLEPLNKSEFLQLNHSSLQHVLHQL